MPEAWGTLGGQDGVIITRVGYIALPRLPGKGGGYLPQVLVSTGKPSSDTQLSMGS